nr:hypothetical protein [Marivita sp.]
MQIGRDALDLLVPVLEARLSEQSRQKVARLALFGDLRVQHSQALDQHAAVKLAIEAGLTFLQTQPAGLKLLHQTQALAVGIGVDAIAVRLTLALQQPELLVVEQRRAREPYALRQFRYLIHLLPCPIALISSLNAVLRCEAVDRSSIDRTGCLLF